MENPWFQKWPQNVRARRDILRPGAPVPKRAMKTTEVFIREGNYPSKFAQIIPFDSGEIPANGSAPLLVRFDDDFPFRVDAFQAIASGFAGAASFCDLEISLPSGRRLTRTPVTLSALAGQQGGKTFVHFRYRFQPSEMVEITVHNRGSLPLRLHGVVYGYKLTGDSRL